MPKIKLLDVISRLLLLQFVSYNRKKHFSEYIWIVDFSGADTAVDDEVIHVSKVLNFDIVVFLKDLLPFR